MKVWKSKARRREQAQVIAHLTAVSNGRKTQTHAGETGSEPSSTFKTDEGPLIVGEEATTFGSEPWWTHKNWNKLPVSQEMTGLVVHNGVMGDLAIAGSTYRGRRHQLRGAPNDDSFRITSVSDQQGTNPWLIAVVSDGVGSAQYSSIGSAVAAENTAALLAHSLRNQAELSAHDYASRVQQQITPFLARLSESMSQQLHTNKPQWIATMGYSPPATAELSDLQATLTAVAVRATPDTDGTFSGVLISIGDSPAFILNDAHYQPIQKANDDNDLHTTSTEGVFGATTAEVTSFTLDPAGVLLLATDGLANFLTHGGTTTTLGAQIAERWAEPIDAVGMARDISFDLSSADDDRTAIAIWPRA